MTKRRRTAKLSLNRETLRNIGAGAQRVEIVRSYKTPCLAVPGIVGGRGGSAGMGDCRPTVLLLDMLINPAPDQVVKAS